MPTSSRSWIKYGSVIFIIILQLIVFLYWKNTKVNYFIDELYSLGYTQAFADTGNMARYITISPDFKYDEWINNENFKQYLVLSDEEKLVNKDFSYMIGSLIFKRNYFGLLNLIESVFNYDYVNNTPAVLLNIIFFIVAEICLLVFLKRLKVKYCYRLMAIIMFGFSSYMISTVEYIRFYMLVIMLMLININLYYSLLVENNWIKLVILSAVIFFLWMLSYNNSELSLAFWGIFNVVYFFMGIMARRKKQAGCCVVLLGFQGLFIAMRTDYFNILFNPSSNQATTAATTAASNIYSFDYNELKKYLIMLKEVLFSQFFSNKYIMCLFVIVLVIGIVHNCVKVRESELVRDRKISEDIYFIISLVVTLIFYTVFEAMCGHLNWRYYCFGFVSFTIVFWYFVNRVFKEESSSIYSKLATLVILCLVITNSVVPFRERNIDFMYENENEFVKNIRTHDDLNTVLFVYYDEPNTVSRHETYECINLMSSDANIKILNLDEYDGRPLNMDKDFLLWCHISRDIEDIIDDIENNGFIVGELGMSHCSKVYYCAHNR